MKDFSLRKLLEGDLNTRTPKWCHRAARNILTIAREGITDECFDQNCKAVAELIHLLREGAENGGAPLRDIEEEEANGTVH